VARGVVGEGGGALSPAPLPQAPATTQSFRSRQLLTLPPSQNQPLSLSFPPAQAINAFEGGVIVVSHDFRLLSQIAKEIWVVENGVTIWPGDIKSYKAHLRKKMNGGGKK
jgi:ATP-binding cassette subfamily F protein 2